MTCGRVARLGGAQRLTQARDVRGQRGRDTQAARVRLEIDPPRIDGAEAAAAERLGEPADRGEAAVVDEHHHHLDAFLHGGDEFAATSSATSRRPRSRTRRGRGPRASRRVRRQSRSPCTSSRTRRGSPSDRGCATACAGRPAALPAAHTTTSRGCARVVDGADHFALAGQRAMAQRVDAARPRRPTRVVCRLRRGTPRRRHRMTGQRLVAALRARHARRRPAAGRRVCAASAALDVDVDEADASGPGTRSSMRW